MSLRFTVDHEWLRLESNGQLTVGITAFAQEALGDVVFVQLPEHERFAAGEEVAVIESVKAASNIAMPLDGTVVAVNDVLIEAPEEVNKSPLDAGWFFRFQPDDTAAFEALMDEKAYWNFVQSNG